MPVRRTSVFAACLVLLFCANAAYAQHATSSISPYGAAEETVVVTVPAYSTPLTGTVTSTAVTPTSGAATFASGTATIGPMTPTLGRDIVLKLWTTNSAAFSCQLFNSADGGTTRLPLSIFDTQIGGPYTTAVNSAITSESVSGTTEWLVCTVTSGTLNYAVVQ